MDIITQGLLGAAVAEAGWRHKLGKGAIVAGVLFGLMPDFDVLANIGGEWSGLVHHRGFTHSVFFAPLIAPLGGYAFWRLYKRQGDKLAWMHLVFWALLTHPLLDVFTSYGTQLLNPISTRRFALDGVSIVDPLYTFPLIAALIIARIWASKPRIGRRCTATALALTTAYLGLGYLRSQQTIEAARGELARQDHPDITAIRAMPTLANSVLWRVVARDDAGALHVGLYSNAAPGPIRFETIEPLDSPLIDQALESERGQIFEWFSDGYIAYRVEEEGDQVLLHMDDMRYGGTLEPTSPLWGAVAVFGTNGELKAVNRTNARAERANSMGEELSTMWRYMWDGPHAPRR